MQSNASFPKARSDERILGRKGNAMKKIKVGDRVRITKDGTSTLFPPDTGYPQKLLLEDAERTGTVTGFSKMDKAVLRVKWDAGSYRIYDDMVLGRSGHLEVRDKGRVDIGSIDTNIHSDFVEVVNTPGGSALRTQSSPDGVPQVEDGQKRSIGSGIWRKVFGLSLWERKQCYKEMMEFVYASMPAASGIDARMRATLRAVEKWGISVKRADQIFKEGQEQGWN
jgi:hypothetical protein